MIGLSARGKFATRTPKMRKNQRKFSVNPVPMVDVIRAVRESRIGDDDCKIRLRARQRFVSFAAEVHLLTMLRLALSAGKARKARHSVSPRAPHRRHGDA